MNKETGIFHQKYKHRKTSLRGGNKKEYNVNIFGGDNEVKSDVNIS